MENTITISVQDDFLENRAHGDTAFPCAAYFTDAKTHDIRWHWHEEYEVSIVRSGSCPLSVGTDHLVLHASPERCIPRKPPRPPVIFIKKISFFTDV